MGGWDGSHLSAGSDFLRERIREQSFSPVSFSDKLGDSLGGMRIIGGDGYGLWEFIFSFVSLGLQWQRLWVFFFLSFFLFFKIVVRALNMRSTLLTNFHVHNTVLCTHMYTHTQCLLDEQSCSPRALWRDSASVVWVQSRDGHHKVG